MDQPDGLVRVLDRINRVAATRGVAVRIGARGTSGQVYYAGRGKSRKGGGWRSVSRTAGDNVIALRVGRQKGRDAISISDADKARIKRTWQEAVSVILRQNVDGDDTFQRYGKRVGRAVIDVMQSYLDAGAGAKGSFKPVLPGTQRAKDRQTQKTGLPPMTRTGQLHGSLVASVRKL